MSMDKKKCKVFYWLCVYGIVGIVCFHMFNMKVYAEGNLEIKPYNLYELASDTNVYENTDINSKVIASLTGKTSIIVSEVTNDDWCKIMYQDVEGYVQKSSIKAFGTELVEGIDQAYNDEEVEISHFVEEVDQTIKERNATRIWMIAIVIFIIAIFAVGIYATIKEAKGDKNK